jgi:hypothetical protein
MNPRALRHSYSASRKERLRLEQKKNIHFITFLFDKTYLMVHISDPKHVIRNKILHLFVKMYIIFT